MADTQGIKAGGNVLPSRFVMLSTSADYTGIQATAAATPVLGVSGPGIRTAPGLDSETYHAAAGEQIELFTHGQKAVVACGGTVTRGDFLTSDANGKAVTITAGQVAHAMAMESGVSGVDIQVLLISPAKVS